MTFQRAQQATHLLSCQFVLLPCVNGCGENVPRRDLNEHLTVCPRQLLTCNITFEPKSPLGVTERCGAQVRRMDLSEHRQTCSLRTVQCAEKCGVIMCARDAPTHNCVSFLALEHASSRGQMTARVAALEAQVAFRNIFF